MARKINWLVSILLTALLITGLMPDGPMVHAAATSGTLSFKVQTVTYNGKYTPRNVGAIWIQDSSGKFVKSLKVWAKTRISYLTNWRTSSGSNTVDAVTSATISSHQLHSVTWDCTDTSGAVVSDGTYRICVEFTEANSTGKYSYFDFTKGTAPVTLTPANQTNFTGISISYQPAAAQTPTPTAAYTPTKTPTSTPTPTAPSATPIKTAAFWSTKASMPNSRSGFGTAAIGNKLYSVGGYNKSSGECLGSVDVYDPISDKWSTLPQELPTKRYSLGIAAANNKLYAIGGLDDNGTALSTVEEYDPASGVWRSRNSMETPRSGFGVAVVNNLIYVIGGYNDQTGQYIDTVERYNPSTDSWVSLSTRMPTARSGFGITAVNGKIYTIGGYGYTGLPDEIFDSVEVYDTVLNSWSKKGSLKNPKADLGATEINGKIYIAGGIGFNSNTLSVEALSDLEEYDITADVWSSKTSMKVNRSSFGIASYSGKAYIIGGMGIDSNEISEVEELTVLSGNSTPSPSVNTPNPKVFSLKGCIAPDFAYSINTAAIHKSNFIVEVIGTSYSSTTGIDGCFEISGIPQGTYSIKISKANYLTRTVNGIDISKDTLLGSESSPLYLWIGDVEIKGVQDGSINMKDIMEAANSFNTTITDARFNENVDFNLDTAINMTDILIVAKHFNKTSLNY